MQVDDDLVDARVPGFLIQPLAENAIRHGLAPRIAAGCVTVTVAAQQDELRVQVRDDGVGLFPGWCFDRDAGIGLRNLADRLTHLYGAKASLSVVNQPPRGVQVDILLPLRRSGGRA